MEDYQSLPEKPTSLWRDPVPQTRFPDFQGGLEVDVVIVGGGIAGIRQQLDQAFRGGHIGRTSPFSRHVYVALTGLEKKQAGKFCKVSVGGALAAIISCSEKHRG